MRTYAASSASYADVVDMLYVLLDLNGSLSSCHSIEDTPSGIIVMYDAHGAVVGAEVPDFSERYRLPAMISVDSRVPFEISVDRAAGIAEA